MSALASRFASGILAGRSRGCAIMATWNPNTYLAYAAERFRPAMDLLQRIPLTNCSRAYDLGCGTGHLTNLLQERWPDAKISGIDNSPEMLAHARSEFPDLDWVEADVSSWHAPEPADLIFSNAAFQWVPNHSSLLPSLMQQVRTGGFLAVQMPHHVESAGHLLILEIARDPRWAARLVPLATQLKVHSAEEYWRWLRPLASQLDIWETIYVHELSGDRPVVEFFRGTQLRSYLHALNEAEQRDFLDSYAEKTSRAFPKQSNGKTLFPFRRIFLLAQR
ncbi:MAG: methyltransferase domain-containing protein [Candidatus Acidiferrales bacterium]